PSPRRATGPIQQEAVGNRRPPAPIPVGRFRSSLVVPYCFRLSGISSYGAFVSRKRLPQVVEILVFKGSECVRGVVRGARIGAAPLSERLLLDTRAPEPAFNRIVSFDAPRLLIDPIRLVTLLREFLLG